MENMSIKTQCLRPARVLDSLYVKKSSVLLNKFGTVFFCQQQPCFQDFLVEYFKTDKSKNEMIQREFWQTNMWPKEMWLTNGHACTFTNVVS